MLVFLSRHGTALMCLVGRVRASSLGQNRNRSLARPRTSVVSALVRSKPSTPAPSLSGPQPSDGAGTNLKSSRAARLLGLGHGRRSETAREPRITSKANQTMKRSTCIERGSSAAAVSKGPPFATGPSLGKEEDRAPWRRAKSLRRFTPE